MGTRGHAVRLIRNAAASLAQLRSLSDLGLILAGLVSRHMVWYKSHAAVLRKAMHAEKSCRCSLPWLSLQALLVECGASGDSLSLVPFRVFSFGVCSSKVFLFRVDRFRESWSLASGLA